MLYDTVPAEARRNDALDDVRSGALDRARWLLDLLDRGRAEFRLAFGTRKGEYRRLEEPHAGIRAEIDEGLATRSDDELRAAALSLLLVARPDGSGVWHYRDRVASLISRRRGWTSGEVAVMLLRVGEYRAGHWLAESLGAVLDAVDRLDTDGRRAVTPHLRQAYRRLMAAEVGADARGRHAGRADPRGRPVGRRAARARRHRAHARSAVGAVSGFVRTHRAAVGSEARTRLAEAQRHLELAQASEDPAAALTEAQRADALANLRTRLRRAPVSQRFHQFRALRCG